MTHARTKMDTSTKRHLWALVVVIVLIVAGVYVITEVPPRQEGRQDLATTFVAGEYTEALTITGGELISVRPAGMKAELATIVEYEVDRGPENFEQFGPVLSARVIHDSGAVMVCAMGRSYMFSGKPSTYHLGCDRTVEPDEVGEWSVAEVTPLRHAPIKYG